MSRPPPSPLAEKESSPDWVDDVPAAIVCVHCGDSDCGGECQNENTQSGIVHIVPWERTQLPWWSRLWSTARLTTVDAEPFFSGLPDGALLPAFRFAFFAELCALTSFVLLALPIAVAVAPGWVSHVVFDPERRAFAVRLLLSGLPLFALVLVSAHAAHGLALDVGASKQGGRRQRSRALRFGLYACGWDLVVGPFGFVVLLAKEGTAQALKVMALLGGLPTRASRAFVAQHYRLSGEPQRAALRTSFWVAAVLTVIAALLLLAALIAILLV